MRKLHRLLDVTTTINANLRAEMARRSITQVRLAAMTGISQPALSRRLTGEAEWTLTEIISVAEALGCPLTSLLPVAVAAS
jgi:transcriptional regulator with XRE-family HTH domain